MSGPDWKDIDSAKRWLEQRFDGNPAAGSPLFQYLNDLGARGLDVDRHEEHLAVYELMRWRHFNNITTRLCYAPDPDRNVFYPEYTPPPHGSKTQRLHRRQEHRDMANARENISPRRTTKGDRATKPPSQPKTIKPSRATVPSVKTPKKTTHQSQRVENLNLDATRQRRSGL